MKETEQFKEAIKSYLDKRAQEDELFRAKYETTTRTIEDVCNYIICEVQKSGRCGFSDMEIYGIAMTAVEEPTLEIGEHKQCSVVVNRHIDLTEEEKAEQKALALRRYQDEELPSCRSATHGEWQSSKRTSNPNPHYSTFDHMKARTIFNRLVAAANERLAPLSPKAEAWAKRKAVEHIAFRTAERHCTCGDCGKTFDYKGGGKYIRCPHCGAKLLVNDCLTRKMKRSGYFATIETVDGLQVERVFLMTAYYKKGEPMTAI